MAVTLRYFTEFGKPAFQHITATGRKKESSRLLSHLLMNFLLLKVMVNRHSQDFRGGGTLTSDVSFSGMEC